MYFDAENNPDISSYQWYIAETQSGTYTTINGATSKVFTPPDNTYEWKYLKFVVTPRSSWDNSPGIPVESPAVQISPSLSNAYPNVDNVVISGLMYVAEVLEGQYMFTDEDSDADCCKLQWYFCATQNGTYTAVSGATSDTFTPPDNGIYEKGYLKFGVIPLACTGNNSPSPIEIRSDAFGPLSPALANQLPTSDPEIVGEYFPNEGREIICVKSTATGLSNCYDFEGAPEVSTYAWYICEDPDGTNCGSVVSTSTTYTPVTAYLGKYLKFEVPPGSQWGNTPGITKASETKMIDFNTNDSLPIATVYSGIKVEGCLGLEGGGAMPAYINELGASSVDGVYQIADTIRYSIDSNTNEPCNPKWCTDYYFLNVIINGTVNGKVAYKHEDYYDKDACYWIAWHPVPICRTARWIADSIGRSRGGGAIAVEKNNIDSYTPPLGDWGDSCGNGVELSLFGGNYNKPGISGDPYVGITLIGDYEYYDADGDTEGRSTFRCLRCNTVNGSYIPIPSAIDITYTLTEQDKNTFIKFEVTPVATTGNSQGNASTSAYAGIGPVIAMP